MGSLTTELASTEGSGSVEILNAEVNNADVPRRQKSRVAALRAKQSFKCDKIKPVQKVATATKANSEIKAEPIARITPTNQATSESGMRKRHAKGLQEICEATSIPFSTALVSKFSIFYDDVIAKLNYKDDNIVGIYERAMAYVYTRSNLPKKQFSKSCNLKVFEKALGVVRKWLCKFEEGLAEKPQEEICVCNLYSIKHAK